jgi:folate-binding protein YgfZ
MDVRKSARIHSNRPRKLRKNIIMQTGWRVITELDFGILRARGSDAIAFLQGQLSNDAARLQADRWQLSGYHTPQGRAIALLRLTLLAPDDVLAVLPRELIPLVLTRLKRFVLRAKVQITDDSAQWRILGFAGAAPALPAGTVCAAYGRSRHLVLAPAALAVESEALTGTRSDWVAADIEDGLPQVYLATSEAFIAQMLNLDVTDGIALDKGCYTGQEIIARAHYRGQVKRRMQRFASATPCTLVPGQTGTLGDGRGFKVVAAVALPDGRSEFLAVANLPASAQVADADQGDDSTAHAEAQTQVIIAARPLQLPYELPAARA